MHGIFIPNRIFIYAGEFADLFSILSGGSLKRCLSLCLCVYSKAIVAMCASHSLSIRSNNFLPVVCNVSVGSAAE